MHISESLDLRCVRTNTQMHTIVRRNLQEAKWGTFGFLHVKNNLEKENMLKCIRSMTARLKRLLSDNSLFLLIWGADGEQASVRQAFWDDSHEIPPQVPLEPL